MARCLQQVTLLIDKYFAATIPAEFFKILALEACKFCVPTTVSKLSQDRSLPWLFSSGGVWCAIEPQRPDHRTIMLPFEMVPQA